MSMELNHFTFKAVISDNNVSIFGKSTMNGFNSVFTRRKSTIIRPVPSRFLTTNIGILKEQSSFSEIKPFYPHSVARVIAMATCPSVRPSVCPSRAGIVSNPRKLAA